MPPALAKAIENAAALLASAGSKDALARYKVAQIVVGVKTAPAKYGERAVETLGRAVKVGAKTLYRYADVVDAWDAKVFRALTQRHDPHGRPLRWSIFVELASVNQQRARSVLLETALEKGLSVRAIQQAASGKTGDEPSPADFLKSIAQKAARLSAALANFDELNSEIPADDANECRNSLTELTEKIAGTVGNLVAGEPE